MPAGPTRHALLGASCALALLVLAPVLLPGFVLNLDMVFVPHQTLLPWNLGIGGGLPRSVPQDAVVSMLAGPLPGQLLQKAVLSASLLLAGVGAGRLAGDRLIVQLPAAALYLWSAFVAQRLLMGHWALLWAYALLPWLVLAVRRARETGRWQPAVAITGVGALVPSGGVVLAAVAIPLLAVRAGRIAAGQRALAVGLIVLFNATWWLPALRSGVSGLSDPLGLRVFGARSDTPAGVVASLVGGGGVWNSQAVLPSRGTWFAVVAAVVVVVLAVAGWRHWVRPLGAVGMWLSVLAVLGLGWAVVSGLAPEHPWATALVSTVPGGGLLRDGQKWAVYWVLLAAVSAPNGLLRVTRHAQRPLQVFLAGALAVLPLSAMPDLAWGAFGRLTTVSYPPTWEELRGRLAGAAGRGDVVSLPWTAFRRYSWNADRVVLDPMPRYLTRTVVWNDRLPVTVGGELVRVEGDDPRAARITDTIVAGEPLAGVLAAEGIRYVVVQTDQPPAGRAPDLEGLTPVWSGQGLDLLEVPGTVVQVRPRDTLVVVVDAIALICLLGVAGRAIPTSDRRQRM